MIPSMHFLRPTRQIRLKKQVPVGFLLSQRVDGCETPWQIPGGLIKDGVLNQYRTLRRAKRGFCVLTTFLKCD